MTRLTRRDWLGSTLALGACGAFRPQVLAAAEPGLPRPAPASAWRKSGVVLGAAEGPAQCFTCAALPLDDGRWRVWYTSTASRTERSIGWAEGRLGEPFKRTPVAVSPGDPPDAPLALGNLPADWRPVQPVYLRLQNGRHRLYFWAHGPKVVRYLVAESDDGRRFRVLDPQRACLYHPGDRTVSGEVAAAVGLQRLRARVAAPAAGEPLATALNVSNDATNVYQLADGSFEMYSVGLIEVGKDDPRYIAHDNCPGWVRVIDRYTSADGLTWTERKRILVPDAQDPPDQQFYYLAVTHTPQGRIGMLGHYRCQAQTMDLEWCFSSDGITWQRPARKAGIARGEPGAPDCYGLYGSHALVERDGVWHLFYTGTNDAHNHKHSYGPAAQVVMHACCERPWI